MDEMSMEERLDRIGMLLAKGVLLAIEREKRAASDKKEENEV